MKNNQNVTIPRWYYRDVQRGIQEILENAPKIGSLNGAMTEYLFRRAEHLPSGMSAADAVKKIRETVDGFLVAYDEGRSTDDIKDQLRSVVSEMDGQQAMIYLSLLETTFRLCDAKALGSEDVPSASELGEKIINAAHEGSSSEIASRVDALADTIMGDSLKAYVFATGNDKLRELASAPRDESPHSELCEQIYAAMCSDQKKAEMFSAAACACYGMTLDGKIPDVTAENLDVRIMTNLIVTGMEKASILTRLSRGEIDMELAKEMLEALTRTLKWVLVKVAQLAIIGGFILSAVALTSWFELVAPTAVFVTGIGVLAGLMAAASWQKEFEELSDITIDLFGAAVEMVVGVLSWTWEKTASVLKNTITPVRATVTPAIQ